MSTAIHALTVPKWGLTMDNGKLTCWNKSVGDRIEKGMEVCDIETEKIANGVESPVDGILRRIVAAEGDVLPIGSLLGIIADESCTDEEIDAAVAKFQSEAAQIATDEPGARGPQPEHIEVAGRRLRHLIQRGNKDAVILVHGFGGNLENWIMNHGDLAATGHTVAALDLPGHGESTKSLESGTLDELADVLAAYMEAVGISEAHLVGHSMGAAVCLELARQAPKIVKSIVLIAPGGLGQAANLDYIDGFASAENRKQLKAAMQLLFANQELVTRQMVDDTLKYKRLEGVAEALRKLADHALAGNDNGVSISIVKVPTLVIWGSRDAVIPPPMECDWTKVGVTLHLLEGCGHMPHIEASQEVNRLIKAFLP